MTAWLIQKRLRGAPALYGLLLPLFLLLPLLLLPLLLLPVQLQAAPLRTPGAINCLAYRPDGNLLAASLHKKILLWDLKRHDLLASLAARSCELGRFQFSPDGRFLAPGRHDCSKRAAARASTRVSTRAAAAPLRLRDGRRSYSPVALPLPAGDRLAAIAFDPQGQLLATLTPEGLIHLFEIPSRQRVGRWRLPHARIGRSLALMPYGFSPRLDLIALQDWQDYYMEIYAFALHKTDRGYRAKLELRHRTEYPFTVHQRIFAFSPKGQFYFDGVRLRSATNGRIRATVGYNSPGSPKQAQFSPDGTLLALLLHHHRPGSPPHSLKSYLDIYDAAHGGHLSTFVLSEQINAFAFHPNSKSVSIGGAKGIIYFWDLKQRDGTGGRTASNRQKQS